MFRLASLSETCKTRADNSIIGKWVVNGRCLQRISPLVSCIFAHLVSKGTTLVLNYLSEDAASLEKWDSISLYSKGKICLLPSIEDLGFLIWLPVSPYRNWEPGNRYKKMLILWLLMLLWPRSCMCSATILKTAASLVVSLQVEQTY